MASCRTDEPTRVTARPASRGHRANILGGSRSVGVGKAVGASIYTQDFGSAGTPDGLISGVHYPQSGETLEFRANWYGSAGPTSASGRCSDRCCWWSVVHDWSGLVG